VSRQRDELRAVVACPGHGAMYDPCLALHERGWLGAMATDYYCDISRAPYRWLPNSRIVRYLGKRYQPALDSRLVAKHPLPGVITRVARAVSRNARTSPQWVFWHNSQFDRWVASQLPRLGNLVFGFESSSLYTFRRAKELGIPCVLYQPIACAETAAALLEEEKRYFPELSETLRYNWFPEAELERRREERRLADAILCASTFTRDSLLDVGVPAEKIRVELYGVNQEVFRPSKDKFDGFSIIWASAFTQTKGIGYLLQAMARVPIPGMQLVLAGYRHGRDAVEPYEDRLSVLRLGHISRQQLGQVMGRCHVHIFPTLVEGFARNIIEAMAAGLPVITTPNSAAPDLIQNGVNGFIVPIRDVKAICDRLLWVYHHPEAAAEIGDRAQQRVAHLTPADYRQRFAARIHEIWEDHRSARHTDRSEVCA
jgi:alpha-maltose-1-phosphate synthase